MGKGSYSGRRRCMYVFVCNLVKRPEFGKRVNLSGARDRRELGQGEVRKGMWGEAWQSKTRLTC